MDFKIEPLNTKQPNSFKKVTESCATTPDIQILVRDIL